MISAFPPFRLSAIGMGVDRDYSGSGGMGLTVRVTASRVKKVVRVVK